MKETMRTIVSRLQSQGHHIDFYVRKDGGILVKSIDGKRFTKGASGNIVARQMAGSTLSEARASQLEYAKRARKTHRTARKLGKPDLDDEIKREWQRVKKKWNRAFKSKGGKPHPAGYFGWTRIQYSIEREGREEALRRIREAEKYASGVAYAKNVEHLADFITESGTKLHSNELLKLAEDMRENAYTIREEWILPAYEALYDLNHGVEPKQVVKNVRKILRLADLNES